MKETAGRNQSRNTESRPADRDTASLSYGEEELNYLSNLYAAAYSDTGMSPEDIWKECICDSLGDMNIFSELGEIAATAEGILDQVKESAEATAQEIRGPPAGDGGTGNLSRDYSGKQVEWAVKNGIITEQERVAFFHMIANIKKLRYKVSRSSFGGYIIDLGNKLLFTDGDWKAPSLSSVIVFDDTNETSMRIAKDVIINGKHNLAGVCRTIH